MFTQALMKDLARILIHVRKIFNFRVSFKILLSLYLSIVEKEYTCDQVTFRMALSEKITTTMTETALIQVYFPNVDSKQTNKMNTRDTMASCTIQKLGLRKTWDY